MTIVALILAFIFVSTSVFQKSEKNSNVRRSLAIVFAGIAAATLAFSFLALHSIDGDLGANQRVGDDGYNFLWCTDNGYEVGTSCWDWDQQGSVIFWFCLSLASLAFFGICVWRTVVDGDDFKRHNHYRDQNKNEWGTWTRFWRRNKYTFWWIMDVVSFLMAITFLIAALQSNKANYEASGAI